MLITFIIDPLILVIILSFALIVSFCIALLMGYCFCHRHVLALVELSCFRYSPVLVRRYSTE